MMPRQLVPCPNRSRSGHIQHEYGGAPYNQCLHAKQLADRREAAERERREKARRETARQKRRDEVANKLTEWSIGVFTAPNDLTALYRVTSSLRKGAVRRGHAPCLSHWLCQLLGDAADAITPGSWSKAAGKLSTDTLVRARVKPWAASIIGEAVDNLTSPAFQALLPHAQLSLTVRAIALLACPEPDRCEVVKQKLSPPVIENMLGGADQ